jgi:hypothetical protein
MKTKRETKNYAIIYFENKKPIKRTYDTVSQAFYEYEAKGCVLVELFNRGTLIASRKIENNK